METTTGTLIINLCLLLVMSGFFSGSETSITSLNRHKLQHNARKKHKDALTLMRLLKKPDRILSAILIGNTLSNILASSIMTIIALRIGGEAIILAAPFILTLVVLIFAEIAPKTVATLYPEKIAYPASRILSLFLKLIFPIVFFTNSISKFLLKLCGIATEKSVFTPLTQEELRGILSTQSRQKQSAIASDMLVGVLNLEQVTVDGVMIPRHEISGLDITASWQDIMHALKTSQRKQIIVYKSVVDEAIGVLELTTAISLLSRGCLNKSTITSNVKPIEYIPEGTALNKQLKNFQQYYYDLGLIVDEYGDIKGLIQLEDIIEEITGKLYQNTAPQARLQPQSDGSYLLSGSYPVRDINRTLDWELPTEGPTTISGLIIEHLETLPEGTVCCVIAHYHIEVMAYKDNTIDVVKIYAGQQISHNTEQT